MSRNDKAKALYLKHANEKARMAKVMQNAHKSSAEQAAEIEQAHLDAEKFVSLN